jgi:membrane fusion protein (multidrug efflux system)
MSRSKILVLLLALPLAAAGCAREKAEAAAPATPADRPAQVRVLELSPRFVADRTSWPADLLPERRATLAAEVGGSVEAVTVQLGESVRAGRQLAAIDERSLAQNVAEAEAWLRQAEQQHERASNLFARKAVTRAHLLDAETNRDVARSRLATARLELRKSHVSAPWAGSVAARHVEVGDFVSPGTPLFDLVDVSRLKVRAPARSADVPYLAIGREVEVTVDALPGERFAARIERMGAELDPDTRTLEVEAEIDNRDGRLKPGMLARITVTRRELLAALVVPGSAVIDLGTSKAVWLVEDGRATRREVTLGPVIGEEVVIEGVPAGSRVIVEGRHLVGEGQKVEEV